MSPTVCEPVCPVAHVLRSASHAPRQNIAAYNTFRKEGHQWRHNRREPSRGIAHIAPFLVDRSQLSADLYDPPDGDAHAGAAEFGPHVQHIQHASIHSQTCGNVNTSTDFTLCRCPYLDFNCPGRHGGNTQSSVFSDSDNNVNSVFVSLRNNKAARNPWSA